jgi:16S rRNA (cytosine967-C5)-methyltransferase
VDLPRIAANQQRTFLHLWSEIRPHVRSDSALPRRIKELLGRNRALGSRDRRLYRELIYTTIRFLPWVEARLEDDPETGAKIVAWLAPDLKPTAHYRAAHCGDWPATPETLVEKAAVLRDQLRLGELPRTGRASPSAVAGPMADGPDEPFRIQVPKGGARPLDALSETRPEAGFHPEPHPFDPQALLPGWFREHCPAAFAAPHLDVLNERARLWVRLQCKETSVVLDEFIAKGWSVRLDPGLPDAISLPPNAEVAATDAYRRGFVEIQDLGSQLVLLHAPSVAGETWLDACAGAGGKTLQLARLVGEHGRVDAADIRAALLDELRDRAARARLDNVKIVRAPGKDYDGVLVDAPCSGTGTWRRLPHMKWYTQPEMIGRFAATQLEILAENAKLVRAGGLLVYATCSLSHHENHDVVAAFLQTHCNFSVEAPARDWGGRSDGLGHTLLPGTRDSDGFYVALLRRQS